MSLRWECLTVDCADPNALARFWQEALGWRRIVDTEIEVVIAAPSGLPTNHPDLLFLQVPDVKGAKNRLHLDLRPDDRDAEVARLVALGARRVDIGQVGDESWVVMADPEGNEFCVLRVLGPGDIVYEGDV